MGRMDRMGTSGGAGPTEPVVGRWGHSFEEDHDDVLVYRPSDYDFPRARGRDGLEFRPDGTFVDWAIGRADANVARDGVWSAASGVVRVTLDSGSSRLLRVVEARPDRLELRREDAG